MIKKPYREDGSIRYFDLLKIMLFISFLVALFSSRIDSSFSSNGLLVPLLILQLLMSAQVVLLLLDEIASLKRTFVSIREKAYSLVNRVEELINSYIISIVFEVKKAVSFGITTIEYQTNKLFLINNVIRC